MKKIGILIFIVAAVGGIILARMFDFGGIPAVEMPSISIFSKVQGSGNLVAETRNVSEFNAVDFGGAFNVEITAGEDYSVVVEADDNLLQFITTRVERGTLRIDTEKRFSTRNRINVKIKAPNINAVDVSGASHALLNNVKNEKLSIDASGASSVKISGTTENLVIDMGGASRIDASALTASKVTVDGGGASNASVSVSDSLTVDLGGASNVVYTGSPSEINKSTSGGSSVSARN